MRIKLCTAFLFATCFLCGCSDPQGRSGGNSSIILLLLLIVIIIVLPSIYIIKQYKKGITTRPIVLSLLCLITFIIGVAMLIGVFSTFEQVSHTVGKGILISSILLTIGGLISLIGIWHMKKWGAFLYLGAQGLSLIINIIDKDNLAMLKATGYISLIIPALCIGIILYHFKKFTD